MKSDEVQKMSDADIKTVVEKGRGKMTGFAGKLTPDQIDAVSKYVKTLKK
jgi:mono/diheme cytochrome c family protein